MALGNDIRNPHHLKNSAHGTTGNNSGPFRSRCHHNNSRTMNTRHIMMNGSVTQRDLHQITTSLFHCFLHGGRNFFGFPFAHANATIAITNNRQSSKTKNSTTFNHFGYAIDRNHFFAQTILWAITLNFCLEFSHFDIPYAN